MCHIFGVGLLHGHTMKSIQDLRELTDKFMSLNVTGGRTASGLSINSAHKFAVLKRPLSSTELVKTPEYEKFVTDNLDVNRTISIVGHCRLKTKGSEMQNVNNHPIVRENVIGVHNGMISNDDSLFFNWRRTFERNGQVDSEIIFALIDYFAGEDGAGNTHDAITRASRLLDGSFACALVHRRHPYSVWIFRRYAPQTILLFKKVGLVMWSTSRNCIREAVESLDVGDPTEIDIDANSGVGLNLFNRKIHRFSLEQYASSRGGQVWT